MRDPRLDQTLFETRHRQLVEQATRDRLADALHTRDSALDRLLAAAGSALIALGTTMRARTQPCLAVESVPATERAEEHAQTIRTAAKPAGGYDEPALAISRPAGAYVPLQTLIVQVPAVRCSSSSPSSPAP
jgi:hypothetical protein